MDKIDFSQQSQPWKIDFLLTIFLMRPYMDNWLTICSFGFKTFTICIEIYSRNQVQIQILIWREGYFSWKISYTLYSKAKDLSTTPIFITKETKIQIIKTKLIFTILNKVVILFIDTNFGLLLTYLQDVKEQRNLVRISFKVIKHVGFSRRTSCRPSITYP